nr:immunoglobulin light chain junction region [Mus musculus]NSL97550.1 immunoglobulin light chain junction region [Mus musculus]NSL97917.1 immunoglobulin light chain junction region [Mus musculus]NSL98366.1 immunoglobulin light chain junction region [Mus musculus]NSL98974.1 immunoglobulin light chain junction region [Mus musculus]
CHQRSSYPWTF